jgi:hypothetical protein
VKCALNVVGFVVSALTKLVDVPVAASGRIQPPGNNYFARRKNRSSFVAKYGVVLVFVKPALGKRSNSQGKGRMVGCMESSDTAVASFPTTTVLQLLKLPVGLKVVSFSIAK